MKVVFVMVGLPHYFTLTLNKLVSLYDVQLTLIIPGSTDKVLGKGVKQDKSLAKFEILEIPEKKQWYGKVFFVGLHETLEKIKPDIVVMSAWPFFLKFALSPLYFLKFKKLKVKLICRDIPFNISKFGESYSYYFSKKNQIESGESSRNLKGYLSFLSTTLLRRIYLPLADAHLNYIDEAKEIISSYGVSKDKIFVSANSPDTDILLEAFQKSVQSNPILPKNPFRIIHVGRLVKWKRIDLLIGAVRDLKAKFEGMELLVLGYGPEEENLKALASKEGVESSVRFVGGVYDPVELGKYLNASAVYVLGGMGGLSINDAMCFAKPVICSVADGTEKRLVREGYNGFYFENGNQVSLNKCLEELLSDPEKVKRFGENSLKVIKEKVNIHTVLAEYMAAFQYVMKNS